MCLYNSLFNNEANDSKDNQLLRKIYNSIENNDNESARVYTNQLIDLQSDENKIQLLKSSLDNLI